MLDKIKHTNSRNEVLDFFTLGIYTNANDLRDFEWSVISGDDRIVGFKKGIAKKKLPFVFKVDPKKAAEIKNKFYEHFEVDVITKKKGYFEINGYKFYCYVTKSTKTDYLLKNHLLVATLEVTTDEPTWTKKRTFNINFSKTAGTTTDALKYAFNYPFTYRGRTSVNIINENFAESDVIIRIYGYAENPMVKIGSNIYLLSGTIGEKEYVEIDTYNKTIFKYSNVGDQTNWFNNRSKEHDIFKKIQSGSVNVSANGEFMVDVEVVERRGEPKWT